MVGAFMQPVETPGIHGKISWKTNLRRLTALNWSDIKQIATQTINNWYSHNAPRLGASLAFYTLLSLAPLLLIVVAIAGLVFGRKAATGQLVWQIQDLVGYNVAETVQTLLSAPGVQSAGTLATILGILALIYGATTVVAELRDALNTIWCVPRREQSGWRSIVSLLRDRTMAFATVIGIGFLLLVSLTVNAALAAAGAHYDALLPASPVLLQIVDFCISYLVISGLFAIIYKLVPDLRLEWRDVIPGALVTGLLFSLGRFVIGMYLGRTGIASAYGAAGSLVVLLLWVYYSAQIFFLGAEFTQAYAQTFGSHPCDRIDRDVRIAANVAEIDQPDAAPVDPDNKEPMVKLT
jgi:membrane protein